MTVAFGATSRNSAHPRSIRALADLVVGGSGVFVFHSLDAETRSDVRLRPKEDVPTSAVLMAGLALVDKAVPIEGEAAELAQHLWAAGKDIELNVTEADALAASVAGLEVTAVVTTILAEPLVHAVDFAHTSWTVLTAEAG